MDAGLNDFHAPGEQHEARDVEVTRLKKDFADFHISHFAERANAVDLFRSENRKGLTTNVSGQRS
jgi:hypothetical protein